MPTSTWSSFAPTLPFGKSLPRCYAHYLLPLQLVTWNFPTNSAKRCIREGWENHYSYATRRFQQLRVLYHVHRWGGCFSSACVRRVDRWEEGIHCPSSRQGLLSSSLVAMVGTRIRLCMHMVLLQSFKLLSALCGWLGDGGHGWCLTAIFCGISCAFRLLRSPQQTWTSNSRTRCQTCRSRSLPTYTFHY